MTEALNAVGMLFVLAAEKYGITLIHKRGAEPERWQHPDGTVLSTEELKDFLVRKALDEDPLDNLK